MITSRPYHPQSQGKVERSHRDLRKNLHYDVHLKSKGVNWVENIPNYIRVLNKLAREELDSAVLSRFVMGVFQTL